MNKEEFEIYLENRYTQQVNWYDGKSKRNHMMYQVFQWITIILSASTPILILVGDSITKWIAVGVSAIVAIATSAIKTFKYQENWMNYRTTCEMLKKEKYLYDASIQGYENIEDPEGLFVERVESLISRENSLWIITHEKEESTGRKKSHS